MNITVERFSHGDNDTLGLLYINGVFECFTLEDEYRTSKVWGETRIPDGRYKVELRTVGGKHAKYKSKFSFHEGMLHVKDVPGFEYILIHIGNDEDDTAGCLLVGDQLAENVTKNGFLGSSTSAYKRLYKKVVTAMKTEDVYITYKSNLAIIDG